MEVEIIEPDEGFAPIGLNIIFRSRAELVEFYHRMNVVGKVFTSYCQGKTEGFNENDELIDYGSTRIYEKVTKILDKRGGIPL